MLIPELIITSYLLAWVSLYLYDSVDNLPDRQVELAKIRHQMISLMPDRHPIALHSIELVFEAVDVEDHADLSESLTRLLCGIDSLSETLRERICIARFRCGI
jgi:hypothetical protein